METTRVEATLEQDGTVTITGLPFHAGDTVEVLILAKHRIDDRTYPLRNTAVRYREPFAPVAEDEWDANR